MAVSSSSRAEAKPAPPPGPLFELSVLLFAALAVPLLKRLPPAELARRLQRRLASPSRGGALTPPGLPPTAVAALSRRIDRVLRAAQPLVRPGCLTRGIARYRFLRQAGADVTLHFGLTRGQDGGVARDGHCWLTLAGEPLAEPRDPRPLYVETFRLPGRLPDGPPVP